MVSVAVGAHDAGAAARVVEAKVVRDVGDTPRGATARERRAEMGYRRARRRAARVLAGHARELGQLLIAEHRRPGLRRHTAALALVLAGHEQVVAGHTKNAVRGPGVLEIVNWPLAIAAHKTMAAKCLVVGEDGEVLDLAVAYTTVVRAIVAHERSIPQHQHVCVCVELAAAHAAEEALNVPAISTELVRAPFHQGFAAVLAMVPVVLAHGGLFHRRLHVTKAT